MKKRKFGYKLSRGKGARKALRRGLVSALVKHGEIETTYTKARSVQPEIEWLVKTAKKQTLAARRALNSRLANNRKDTDAFYQHIWKAFEKKKSGFTTIKDQGVRIGDGARIVRFAWSSPVEAVAKQSEKSSAKKEKKVVKTKSTKKKDTK